MRHVLAMLLFIAGAFDLCSGSDRQIPSRQPVTLLIQFESDFNSTVFETLRSEVKAVMENSGIPFGFRELREGASVDEMGGLVVVKFRGRCRLDPKAATSFERGQALAFTHSSDGVVLPFTEVSCERVSSVIKSAMTPDEWRNGDQLLGRALGRVLSHELYHILLNTKHHAAEGIAQHALSGRQLIAQSLKFRPEDLHRLASPR